MPEGPYHIEMLPNSEHLINPPRWVLDIIRESIRKELFHLIWCDIMQEVSETTNWFNSK